MLKNFDWKKDLLPHIMAIAIFLLMAIIVCYPALSGQVLSQPDIIHWKGMAQNAFEYKAIHGHFPLWNTHLFSGTPNYQTAMDNSEFVPNHFIKILTVGLPNPASFFFLASICFYILAVVFRFNLVVRMLTALAFAYCTYNPVIAVAGHETKFIAIALMPALLAGILLIFKRKYIVGLAVTCLFATLQMRANHIQITYYLLLVIAIMAIAYIIHWIKTGQYKHMIIALSLSLLGGAIGIGNFATVLLTTAEYSRYTMRGGKALEIGEGGEAKEITHTKGLDNSYAFMWSMHKAEPLQMMMPNAFGGGSANTFAENEKFADKLSGAGLPGEAVAQLSQMLPQYWGGLEGTSGPVYIGVIICLLAIIGFVLKIKHRWWILAATVLGIVLAWGKYFGLNDTLFNLLPLYNKFRAPSMALVIPQLTLPLMAGICLQTLLFNKETNPKEFIQKNFKKITYALGGTIIFLLLVYLMNDYGATLDDQIKQMFANPQAGGEAVGASVINALKDARKGLFFSGILRVVLFSGLLLGALYLFMKNQLKAAALLIILTIINTVDLLAVGKKYMNAENFMHADDIQAQSFAPKPYDQQILQDKDPHYRVFNLANGDPFQDAITSYHHRSIGGYHPAKLSIYQDLIQGQMARSLNPGVLNMLDTKYIVGQDGNVMTNPDALGAAWFVKHVQFVANAAAEMNAMNHFNPKDTAVVQESFKNVVGAAPAFDSTASIQLTNYSNDEIKYKTISQSNQFAVLSEVYYPAGWNAYIDGKQTEYAKVNYALRGIAVPAGEHEIVFKFEPSSVKTGNMLIIICNSLLLLILLFAVIFVVRKKARTTVD